MAGLLGMLLGRDLTKTLDQRLKLWRQGFLAKSTIHRPKSFSEVILICAAEPWLWFPERAGQQLHGMSCGSDGGRSHVAPQQSFLTACAG